MTETIVELRNITKRFPGIVANDDVTLDRKGEIFALLGKRRRQVDLDEYSLRYV